MWEREDSDAKDIAEFELNRKNIKLEDLKELDSIVEEVEVKLPHLDKV